MAKSSDVWGVRDKRSAGLAMANKPTATYVWVTRDRATPSANSYYCTWDDNAELITIGDSVDDFAWHEPGGEYKQGLVMFPKVWKRMYNLYLRPGQKRRAKITKLPGGGCRWEWAK